MTKAANSIKGGAPNGTAHLAIPKWGRLAQLVEQLTLNQRVVGSNPSASTIISIYADIVTASGVPDERGFREAEPLGVSFAMKFPTSKIFVKTDQRLSLAALRVLWQERP